MVLQFESIIWTSYMERRCFFKTFLCSKLLFLDVQRWVFFQETQTGQPSDNFPWFFDLNPSFERNASRVDAFTSFIWRWNFLLFVFDVEYFSTNSNRPIKQQFPMVLRLVYILSTYCTNRRCFYFFSFDIGTFCCLFFRLNIFPETQTGQPSNNFPWFFDLFTSFRRTAPREYVFILLHSTEGVYFLLDVSFVLGDTSSYQNFQFEISLLWKCYFVQSL